MRLARVLVVGGALLVGAPPLAAQASDARAPDDALAVRVGDHWVPWWSAARAPARWDRASPVLERAVVWTRIANGVELATLRLTAAGALPFRVVLVRLDPARLHFDLVRATRDEGLAGAWTLDSLPGDALFGVNAGQFVGGTPWGWLVVEGAERQAPGTGSLAMALVLDATGAARLSSAEETSRARSVGDA
ncbi:MAG TPA: hypothetical protein VEA99_15065, partial [Gemmatimonadaceae bacterium]|nr:hypothetical protein [Gemmatimonadaceae bacterium]